MFSQFFFADFFAKFFEDVNEVFYAYKSICIFVIFAKNCPGIDLPLVRRSCHFDKSPKLNKSRVISLARCYVVAYISKSLLFDSFMCKAGLASKTKFYAFNDVNIVLRTDPIVVVTKGDSAVLIYMPTC